MLAVSFSKHISSRSFKPPESTWLLFRTIIRDRCAEPCAVCVCKDDSPQGKLVRVTEGEIYDVAVDIRRGSPTFKHWVGVTLSAENFLELYVPPGFAHGFCVTSDIAEVQYKCSEFYAPDDEMTLAWNDPEIRIAWPIADPLLSERDRAGRTIADALELLPRFEGSG